MVLDALDAMKHGFYYILGSCTTDNTVSTHTIQDNSDHESWEFHQEYDLTSYSTGVDFFAVEDHHLDLEYPHNCHKCGHKIKWCELLIVNKNKDEKHLEKLWKSKIIEFYCCDCYNKKIY